MAMTIGVISPGDMGHTIGNRLREHGATVLTSLDGRSERSRGLAAKAGMEDAGTLDDLVRRVDVLLAVLVPSEATGLSERVAGALTSTGASPLYVDCNAIAPHTVRAIGDRILAAGGRFADVGIIGPPPKKDGTTRFYVSGPGADEFGALAEYGLDVRPLGAEVGKASGFKMCYAALTKGITALGTEMLVAARLLGIEAELREEQLGSVPDLIGSVLNSAPSMPPKAYRWVGEMEEIAATFGALGMTSKILDGAAEHYAFIAETALGKESPESRDTSRDADGVVAALADALLVGGAKA
jgi:3-hydroxyisobutyrate dehydrogenase-like beta-hydroxyacid dehydrogenase